MSFDVCAVFLEERDLLTEGVGQQTGYDGGSVDVVVGVVLLTLGLAGLLAWEEPHVELLRGFTAKTLFQLVGDLIGIDEMAVHATGHVLGCFAIEAVGVDERVALHRLRPIRTEKLSPFTPMVLRKWESR